MQPSPAHAQFWQWFRANGERLRTGMYGDDEAVREEASEELRHAVQAAEPGLILEIGQGADGGPHPLIVSADGKPEQVDAVKDFVAAAPTLPGWQVIAFRTRLEVGEHLEIAIQDERVGPDDIRFRVSEGDEGLDLTLYVRGLTDANRQIRGLGASLLAEHAVGERDALTMLRSLEIEPLPARPAPELRPFHELPDVLDEAKARKYPPPGSLPIDMDGDWLNMRGTINGSFASVLLNGGLAPVAGHPAYDRRLTVSIRFNESRDDGMPATEEEYAAVSELGDRLGEALQENQQSLLALTLMTQGRRDLVLYTSNAGAALLRLEELRTGIRSHRIKVAVERETFWGMYRSFHQAAAGAEEEEEDGDGEE
jgi:hypothetical protein